MTCQKIKILLVEDNQGDANLLKILLEEAPFHISIGHVRNGEEALSYLHEHKGSDRPDLIILDLKMPRMDGLEFLKERGKDRYMALIPTVVLTGSDARSDQERAVALGADMYMMKPGNLEEGDMLLPALEMFIKQRNLCRSE